MPVFVAINEESNVKQNYAINQLVAFANLEAFLQIRALGVNLNSGNTDTAVLMALPSGVTRYHVMTMQIAHASASLTTATIGLFTATGGGGTAVVTGGSAITVNTASENTNNNSQTFMANNQATQSYTAQTLYIRVGTAQGSPATADVTVTIRPLS